MATNSKGYPYPVGTDRVMDGDDAIKALADAVAARLGNIAVGKLSITPPGNDTAGSQAVTFPAGRFSSVPWIVAIPDASAQQAGVIIRCWITVPTTTGCTVNVSRSNGAATQVGWLAIENT
jgi:hypothetical protein